jgi:hypothetical protein
MAWGEPSCQHALVLVVGAATLDSRFEQLAKQWLTKRSGHCTVLTALVPPLTHSQVFAGGRFPVLSTCIAAPWGGSPMQLAESVLADTMLDEKPGVFISYIRLEASAGAEDIYQALSRLGYRVFLDRFNGTPGRVFPLELAEAMSSMGLVALLETSGLRDSRWTMWEAVFAARFRLGPVAVNFQGAPPVRAAVLRRAISHNPAKALPTPVVDDIAQFIRDNTLSVAVSRSAYFESLVRSAAQDSGGDAAHVGGGVLSLEQPAGNPVGCVLPAAVPGRLKHVTRLVRSRHVGPYVLAGEHQHLARGDRDDLQWLAAQTGVTLAGSASVYRTVRRIMP